MLRALVLSLAILVGMGTIIPLATDYTEAGVKKSKKKKKKRAKYKKYSKQWWRAYRQRVNRNKSIAKRKRQMRIRQILLARQNDLNQATEVSQKSTEKKSFVSDVMTPALLPTGEKAPLGWKSNMVTNGELQFRVEDTNGAPIGLASIAVVGPAMNAEAQTNNLKNKTVGGVPTNSLRSTVIDRMIKENGWVVNDYQKEIGGKKVYVVAAQSEGAGGVIQSRMFYFTEVDGRIYSVATTSPTETQEKLVKESEKVIDSLSRPKANPQQAMKEE